jgi:hypothetical protein
MNPRCFSVFSVPTVIFCVLFALIYLAVKTGTALGDWLVRPCNLRLSQTPGVDP